MRAKLLIGCGLVIAAAAALASFLASSPASAQPVATSGTGGMISIGTPTLLPSGYISVPITTTTAADPYLAFNVGLAFDTSLTSLGAFDSSGTVLPTPVVCLTAPNPGVGVVVGCSSVGVTGTTTGGLLVTLILAPSATAGCSNLHLITLNEPDNADPAYATYTVNAADTFPQSNTYGPDVTIDTQTGATGCTVGTTTPTATPSPSATATPSSTPTSTPTATSTPPWFHCLTPERARDRCGRKTPD